MFNLIWQNLWKMKVANWTILWIIQSWQNWIFAVLFSYFEWVWNVCVIIMYVLHLHQDITQLGRGEGGGRWWWWWQLSEDLGAAALFCLRRPPDITSPILDPFSSSLWFIYNRGCLYLCDKKSDLLSYLSCHGGCTANQNESCSHFSPTRHLSLGNASNWKLIIILMNVDCHYDDGQLWSANIFYVTK